MDKKTAPTDEITPKQHFGRYLATLIEKYDVDKNKLINSVGLIKPKLGTLEQWTNGSTTPAPPYARKIRKEISMNREDQKMFDDL